MTRKATLASLVAKASPGILLNDHFEHDGQSCSRTPAGCCGTCNSTGALRVVPASSRPEELHPEPLITAMTHLLRSTAITAASSPAAHRRRAGLFSLGGMVSTLVVMLTGEAIETAIIGLQTSL